MKHTLVFATNNRHKIDEVRALLEARGTEIAQKYDILSLTDINCHDDIPETSDTFLGNARQKANFVKEHYGYDCFADDSGLEVVALGMQPGVHSARYASEKGHDAEANNDKLLTNMRGIADRSAQFHTTICLLMDGKEHVFEGICKGSITLERSGCQGFGYDPLFRPDGYDVTFAEMDMNLKNTISHRGLAVSKLIDYLSSAE